MGNLSTDVQQFLHDLGVSNTAAIAPITDFIGSIADIASGIGAIAGVAQLVEGWLGKGQLDEINTKLDNIKGILQEAINIEASSQILERNKEINDAIHEATDALKDVPAAKRNPSLYPPSGLISGCQDALGQMSAPLNDWMWNSTYALHLYWTDQQLYSSHCYRDPGEGDGYDVGYGRQTPPTNSDGVTVLDYTVTLPLYLLTVSSLIAVAGSFDPSFASNNRDFLGANGGAAEFLQKKHDLIVGSGLRQLVPPKWTTSLGDIACPPAEWNGGSVINPAPASGITLIDDPSHPEAHYLMAAKIEYGAVEKYSGYSSISDNYQIDISPSDPSRKGAVDPGTYGKLLLRLLKRTKDVYVGVGLQNVWRVSNQLRALVDDPLLTNPTFVCPDGSVIDLRVGHFAKFFVCRSWVRRPKATA